MENEEITVPPMSVVDAWKEALKLIHELVEVKDRFSRDLSLARKERDAYRKEAEELRREVSCLMTVLEKVREELSRKYDYWGEELGKIVDHKTHSLAKYFPPVPKENVDRVEASLSATHEAETTVKDTLDSVAQDYNLKYLWEMTDKDRTEIYRYALKRSKEIVDGKPLEERLKEDGK